MKRNQFIFLFFFLACLLLSACNSSHNFAPVTDGWSNANAASRDYRVQKNDTLYSIAFRYGLDYRKLADANHISMPYHIVTGQKLQLLPEADDTLTSQAASSETVVTAAAPPTQPITSQPVVTSKKPVVTAPLSTSTSTAIPVTPTPEAKSTGPVGKWLWPAKGQVIHTFSSDYAGNKGIDIVGKSGDPVKATASGKVVYAGSGLKGYGLLIIIKHNTEYLSAYAHNSKLLVKEGEMVKSGETIALMGNTDASQVLLHFEIRQAGKPVDPLKLLTPR
jgi:lipoprotein NlpD